MSSGDVVVDPYSPSWPTHFLDIKASLASHLSSISILSIEHVGSTSVPGLAARPFIDIDIVVKREDLQATIACLVAKSFTYLGELGINNQHAFIDPDQEPKRNVYVCVEGATQTCNHLAVRDTLRNHAELRDQYGRVKMELARKGTNNIDYIEAKSSNLQKILRTAGLLTGKEIFAMEAVDTKGKRFGVVNTGREGLVLREFVLADDEAFFELESLEEVVRYQTWEPRTREQAKELVLDTVRSVSATPRVLIELAVEWEGRFIGRVGAKITTQSLLAKSTSTQERKPIQVPHADLWFSFLPSYQGKGLATEAMKCFIPLLKAPLELEIECDPRNTGSIRMAERLNFEKISEEEGVFECKGEWVGSAVFRKVVVGL